MPWYERWPASRFLDVDSLRRAAPILFLLWTVVIGVATLVTWDPGHRFGDTFGSSAGIWGRALLFLPVALAARAGPIFWVVTMLYAQWAIGRAVAAAATRRLGTSELGGIAQLLIGQGLMVAVVFGLGTIGKLTPAPLVSMVVAIVAVQLILGRDLHRLAARLRTFIASQRRSWLAANPEAEPLAVRLAVALVIALFLGAGLLTTLHPVWFYDALAYHLGTPNEWLVEGGFSRNPSDVLSHFPGHNEALSAIAMAGGGTMAAQLLNFSFLPLLLLWAGPRRCGNAAGAMWARLILTTTPVILMTATQSKPDLALLLYGAVTVEHTLNAARDGDAAAAAVSGLFAGMCVASKYTAVALILIPLLLVAGLVERQAGRGGGARAAATHLGLWLGGAAVFVAPWLLRNLLWTGNPLYPALFGIFGGDGWSAAQALQLASDTHARALADVRVADLWTLAWELTFSPWGALVERFGAFGVLGPGYLWLIPLGLCAAEKVERSDRTDARRWWLVVLGSAVFSFFGLWILRYMAVVLPWIAVLVGAEIGRAPRFRTWRGAPYLIVALMIGMANSTYVAREALARTGGMAVIAGDMTDDQFLLAMAKRRPIELGTYELIGRAGALTRGDLMMVGDTVHAYVAVPHTHASALNPPAIIPYLDATDSPGALARALDAAGFTHLLYNPDELLRTARRGTVPGMSAAQRAALDALRHSDAVSCLAGACSGDGPALYEINPEITPEITPVPAAQPR